MREAACRINNIIKKEDGEIPTFFFCHEFLPRAAAVIFRHAHFNLRH